MPVFVHFISLVAFLLPPVIDLINNKISSSHARFWVSVLFCAVVGTGVEYVMEGGVLTFDGVSEQIMITFGMAQLVYGGVYEGSRVDIKLKSLQGVAGEA